MIINSLLVRIFKLIGIKLLLLLLA